MTSLLGTEWHVEPGDPSVGIFGHAIYHEACPADEPAEAIEEVVSTRRALDTLYIEWLIICPACGVTATYTDTEYDPIEEI